MAKFLARFVLLSTIVLVSCQSNEKESSLSEFEERRDTYELEDFNDTITARYGRLEYEYAQAVEKVRWNTIFDPVRLKSDRDLSQSRRMIEDMRLAETEFDRKRHELNTSMRDYIEMMNFARVTKDNLIKTLNDTTSRKRIIADSIHLLDLHIINKVDTVFSILKKEQGRWVISEEKVLFEKAKALNTYNTAMQDVNILAQRQATLRNELKSLREE